jgi:CxxC motif-containing protein (DUF1111 family)
MAASSRRLSVMLAVLTVLCLAVAPNLSAQGIDPGPRPPGTNPAPPSVCNVVTGGIPLKFPLTPCLDINQPPSNPAQPPAAGAGEIINNSGNLTEFWFQALSVFETTAFVTSSANPPQTIVGLGPSFNALSCFACHSEPTVGGASPGKVTVNGNTQETTVAPGVPFLSVAQNPEFIAASANSATNTLPCFIGGGSGTGPCGIPLGDFPTEDFSLGPVVEVRFPNGFTPPAGSNIDPVLAGAVANLFTFTGRTDENAPGCTIQQEPITAQIQGGNAIFRTPTPTFGLGFVENTSDLTLENNLALFASTKAGLQIHGTFNRSGNDQTITKFGWKAQNKSLMIFAGEASNVEMGVTNELFPNERTTGSGSNCTPNELPEDEILNTTTSPGDASQISSSSQNNAVFMRLNGAPAQCDFTSGLTGGGVPVCKPLTPGGAALQGQCFFGASSSTGATFCATVTGGLPVTGIGCVLCHSDRLTTSNAPQQGLANFTYAPYSDFALHNMGSDGDGVMQGNAGPTQFRTAPLWGAGQRFFFMHDGRFIDLDHAIRGHCPNGDTPANNESCAVVQKYENNLSPAQETLILDFLRSL